MTTEGPPSYFSEPERRRGTSEVFLLAIRAFFVLMLCAVGLSLLSSFDIEDNISEKLRDIVVYTSISLAFIVIALDIWLPRKSLQAIAGLFFGLVVGMVIAFGFSLVINLIAEAVFTYPDPSVVKNTKLMIGITCCYVCVSFVLQTKDDVRFVIPYIEFSRQTKGGRPLILDTSVIIDGRIADIAETRIIEAEMTIPRFVLKELQLIADSGDKLKRARGRRGLDMLNKLQSSDKFDIRLLDVVVEQSDAGVDEMLVDLAVELNGKIVTNDYNLNKIAQLRGVTVININDLANSLKPVVLPGEGLTVKVIKPGEEVGQGVGYLEDGTMVVAEGARDRIGQVVNLTVTSVLQTSAGRMIFGRVDAAGPDRRRPRSPEQ